VVYFYFNYESKDSQTALHIKKTIIKQLVAGIDIPQSLESLYHKHISKSTTPDIAELRPVFEACSKPFPSRYAVFDAFDECSDGLKQEIVGLFVDLQKFGYRLLISGRPPMSMSSYQNQLSNVAILDITTKEEDIKVYIMQRLQSQDVSPRVRTGCLELVKDVDKK
jgi:hypothetical protein